MRKQKGGRIINISSVVGIIGNSGQANYTATKGGVIALTKTIAREYASSGILCNAIAPGLIATDMAAKMDEKYRETIMKSIPLGRFGDPKEVAGLVKVCGHACMWTCVCATCVHASMGGGGGTYPCLLC